MEKREAQHSQVLPAQKQMSYPPLHIWTCVSLHYAAVGSICIPFDVWGTFSCFHLDLQKPENSVLDITEIIALQKGGGLGVVESTNSAGEVRKLLILY